MKLIIGLLLFASALLSDCPDDIAKAPEKELQKFFPADAVKSILQAQPGTFSDYNGPDAQHVKACANASPTVRARVANKAKKERPRARGYEADVE